MEYLRMGGASPLLRSLYPSGHWSYHSSTIPLLGTKYITTYTHTLKSIIADNTYYSLTIGLLLMKITKQELKTYIKGWQTLDNKLSKVTTTTATAMDEIQKTVATMLSTKKKQAGFCLFMEQQFKIDKKVNGRLQTCINKPNTQRYILKVPSDQPLKQAFRIRTASKELLKYKLGGKAIVDQKMIDTKGVYHAFKYDLPKVKKPTQISKTQAVVDEFSITKEQYLANAESGKIKFATVD